MKEQTMKETTLKVKNQTTTLQKAIILGDIVFMIGSFSVFLCNLLISYILYRNEGKEGRFEQGCPRPGCQALPAKFPKPARPRRSSRPN